MNVQEKSLDRDISIMEQVSTVKLYHLGRILAQSKNYVLLVMYKIIYCIFTVFVIGYIIDVNVMLLDLDVGFLQDPALLYEK